MTPRYCDAQRQFIKDARGLIDIKQHAYFDTVDWRNVTPAGGKHIGLTSGKKAQTDSFYVKSVAPWVPHLLIPQHVPSCPRCKKNTHVDTASARWVAFPKLLYDLTTHKYLDTKLYPCLACNQEFTGYNKESLAVDAKVIVGYFNMYLAGKHTVTPELYSFIVNSLDTSSARIARHLQKLYADNYLSDYQIFLHAVRAERIKSAPTQAVSHFDMRQPTIMAALDEQRANATPVNRVRDSLLREIRNLKWLVQSAEAALDLSEDGPARNKLCFRRLLKDKRSRNNQKQPLPSIGVGKLQQLIDLGVNNAVELLQFDDVDGVFWSQRTRDQKLNSWKSEVEVYYSAKRTKARDLVDQLKAKEDELKAVDSWRDIDAALEPATREVEGQSNTEPVEVAAKPLPLLFSTMTDPVGYNVRFMTTGQVNSIQECEFRHRKPMQDAKMMGLSGEILKIDWSHKVAGKTYVYTGPGICFKPCTNMLNIQNEDALTILWKATDGGESLLPIKADLICLKQRNMRLQKPTKAIYIDVCCKFRKGLQDIFGSDVFVGLDCFHWMKRWDRALAKPKSEKGATFRASISQAVFVIPPDECEGAKKRLIDRRKANTRANKNDSDTWEPSVRQIRREANAIIPSPDKLQQRVMAFIRYAKFCDAETDVAIATRQENSTDPLPLRFFKNSREAEDVIQEQLSHVAKGCLSDPPNVAMHHLNPKTNKYYTRRGTSSIESDHRGLNQLTGNHVGVGLCDRKSSTYFELLNEKKRLNRLGGEDYDTHRTETLALLNSMAFSVGYTDENLPYPGLSVPGLPPAREREHFGFTCVNSMTNEAFLARYQASQAGISTDNTDEYVDEDVDPEEGAPSLEEVLNNIEEAEREDSEDPETEATADAIETAIARITPLIRPYESTAKAHERLTNQQPWYPFHSGTAWPSAVHQEEFAVFDTMQSRFKRGVGPRANGGYQYFANEWNREVANRYRQFTEGEEVTLIRRKSAIQLQEHFDRLKEKKRMAVMADSDTDRTNRIELREVMQSTRNDTVVHPIPAAQALQYPTGGVVPFGMPAPLNPEIIQGAVHHQPLVVMQANATVGRPWQIQRFATTQNVLVGYRKGTWRVSCGHRKLSHIKEESFGYKCKRDYCARCGWLKDHHQQSNFLMGPYCTNPAKFDSPHTQWYDMERRQVGVI